MGNTESTTGITAGSQPDPPFDPRKSGPEYNYYDSIVSDMRLVRLVYGQILDNDDDFWLSDAEKEKIF